MRKSSGIKDLFTIRSRYKTENRTLSYSFSYFLSERCDLWYYFFTANYERTIMAQKTKAEKVKTGIEMIVISEQYLSMYLRIMIK